MANAAGRLGYVGFRNEVANLGIVAKCLEAVRESLRNVNLPIIRACQLEGLPAAVGRRVLSDVDDYVPDGALQTVHEFHFAMRFALIVHAAQGAPARGHGDAVLWIAGLKTVCCELVDAERASEEATVVLRRLQKNEPGVLQVR